MSAADSEPAPRPAPDRKRAPPPPVPTSIIKPTSESEPNSEPTPEVLPDAKQQLEVEPSHTEPGHTATGQLPNKRKHRGLMRAIGGFFKRSCSGSDNAARPNDSESSERCTSRWSHSHGQSLPEAPFKEAHQAGPETALRQERESVMTSPRSEVPPVKKVESEQSKKAKKARFLPSQSEQSPTDPSEMPSATLVDEKDVKLQRVSFLFFGGSDAKSTFEPKLNSSELDTVHENDIRPSLQAKMPLFLSPPLPGNLRRSSILPDPMEYEL